LATFGNFRQQRDRPGHWLDIRGQVFTPCLAGNRDWGRGGRLSNTCPVAVAGNRLIESAGQARRGKLRSMLYSSHRLFSRAYWRWPHFTPEELACRCGGRGCRGAYWHDGEFLDALEALRKEMGRPLKINSGHRCAIWNAVVGGVPGSQHRRIAVDIAFQKHDRRAMVAAAEWLGFTGIGIAKSFLHLDRREIPARWTYPGAEDFS
jgi:zinc D-Ala-D-Ala carboxypeptidase